MADQAPPPAFVIAVGAIWPPVCALAVSLRFFGRRKQHVKLSWDDWMTIPALVLTWGMGAVIITSVALKSLAYPTPKTQGMANPLAASNFEIRTTRTTLWAFELMQIPALGLVKLSFIFFYRRLFCDRNSNRSFNIATWLVIGLITAWTVSFFLALLFACKTHFAAYWTSVYTVSHECVKTLIYENAFAISDTMTDIIVFVLPIPQIWKLHMSFARKISVTAIFSLGALTIAASMTRMVIFIRAVEVDFKPNTDNDLIITGGLYWSMLESGLGLCTACLPTLYGLFKGPIWESVNRTIQNVSSTSWSKSWRSSSLVSSKNRQRVDSNVSLDHILPFSAERSGTFETHAVRTFSNHEDVKSIPDRIRITNTIVQTDSEVA